MKNEILERAMFAMPLSKDARNSGIMAGFEDDMPEDAEEESMEEMPPMARTPQNPEILMNTLRGDMRSLDARYQELAQMVGEEAAMDTPPEVLAMLQPQLAAPAAGIGALPQAQGMMPPNMGMPPPGMGMPPPGMGMPPPDQMGAPQPAPAMPQGGIPMPAGMESAPPFSPGAEAPQGYAFGGVVRGAQMVGDKLGQYGSAANAALGRMFMNPQGITQPVLENVRGPGGRYTAEQVVRGGETLTAPTFTQGLQQGPPQALTWLTDQYPRLSSMAVPASLVLGLANISRGGASIPRGGASEPGTDMASQIPRDTIEDRVANSVLNKPAVVTMSFDKPFTTTAPDRYKITEGAQPPSSAAADLAATIAAEQAAVDERQVAASDKASADPLGFFINQKLKAFDERAAKGKPLSKMERIKASQAEYAPLFEELLGSDKESAKINALLLLSEAGLKLASSTKPTFAMALSDSFAGVPRGVAAIAAQERELALKTKSASLQQAISDVGAEDAAAAARQKLVLDYTMKMELEKTKQGGTIYKNAGAGGRIGEDKNGNFKGFFIDSDSQDYRDIAENPVLVNNFTPVNPFAKDMGKATTVTAKSLKKREEIEEKMNLLTGLIAKVDTGLSQITNAYSPGTFVNNLANNVVVPLVPNFVLRPDVYQAGTIAALSTVFSDITRGNAEVGGKLSVQGEKWARENLKAIQDPAGLLKNPELAAKVFGTIKTAYFNEFYGLATQLGIGDRNIVVSTPPTGTKNDPFVMPKDEAEQQQMLNYLKIQFGAVDDPKAMIYVQNPDGKIAATPVQNFYKLVGQ
jgi:hypothetical protein